MGIGSSLDGGAGNGIEHRLGILDLFMTERLPDRKSRLDYLEQLAQESVGSSYPPL